MAVIKPIRGLRYNPESIGSRWNEIVCPPYDVISGEEQRLLYDRHPFNAVRLEYGLILPGDNETENRYRRAAGFLSEWLAEGVLRVDQRPSLYLYEQEFTWDGKRMVRSSFLAGLLAEPYETGMVRPHEDTFPKAKSDRLSLLLETGTCFSPIYALYLDPENKVSDLFRKTRRETEPLCAFVEEGGQGHRLWVVPQSETTDSLEAFFNPLPVFIADGHHRYETALKFSDIARSRGSSADHTLVAFSNAYDPGLIVLPTHRIVSGLRPGEPGEFPALAKTALGASVTAYPSAETLLERFDSGAAAAARREGWFTGGYLAGGNGWLIEFPVPGGAGGAASPRDLLDVSLLHRYLLPLLWKDREPGEALVPGDARITGETPAAGEKLVPGKALVPGHAQSVSQHGGFQGPASRERDLEKPVVSYTRDAREAYRAASVSDGTAAFLLLPPKVEEIIAVASAGGRMPEKSTYFYPKPVSGLVFYQPD